MSPRTARLVLIASLVCASPAAGQPSIASPTLRVARIFGTGMVLQRGAPIPVWGWSAPDASVSVSLHSATRTTKADRTGAWKAVLPAHPAGGPHELTIRAGAQQLRLQNVLVGDVWVASGQSNMEWPLADALNGRAEIAAANDSRIRHFKVPTSHAPSPEADLAGGEWTLANPQQVGQFSAVAYFFARDLRKSVDVPIGIINTSWGGSRIEPWMSRNALGITDAKWNDLWRDKQRAQDRLVESMRAKLGDVPKVDSGLVNGRAVWADPALDDATWSAIDAPKPWEQAGYPGMDGVAWYRTTFTLTAAEAARGVTLGLGEIDDADISWVNGTEIGRTQGWNTPRVYAVPPLALRAGRNVIAVRADDTGGGGGIAGDSAKLFVDVGGARRSLAGSWKFKVGAIVVQPDGQQINKVPTVLYNKMVHPLLAFPIKGVLWYQGESNADRLEDAVAYGPLFKTMITSWRREWGRGDMPFLWVQLANFMAPDAQPAMRSAWATLREAQTAALALPNTAQAVITDIGEERDIHPRNKHDVGARLALAARRVAYGQRVVATGPTHRAHTLRGGRVIVRFDHVGAGLVSRATDGAVGGFAVAGADRKFVWADARIQGTNVVVSSPQVPSPVAVRYAWGNNPNTANLYNRQGLPAVPFRTDAW